MEQNTSLVITSIRGADNPVLKNYAKLCAENKIHFIIAGDSNSPALFQLDGCDYLDIKAQHDLPFLLPKLLPNESYAKKNSAYLQAIKKGSQIIIETDDDNLSNEEFWLPRNSEIKGDLADSNTWINVYRFFSDELIWPRGFSLQHIKDGPTPIKEKAQTYFSPIQQALVNENPDVDAIYRLTMQLPFNFKTRDSIILDQGAVCPFNSQNTTWFKRAFPLMYLPSYCSFRMCDIWRSFIAQRIMWTNGWHLSFHNSNAYQQRNAHDLMKDFEQETSGYLNNDRIVKDLKALHLKEGEEYIYENLRACYKILTDKNYIEKNELSLLEAWISDLQSLS